MKNNELDLHGTYDYISHDIAVFLDLSLSNVEAKKLRF